MTSELSAERFEELKQDFLREQKFALLSVKGNGEAQHQCSWLNMLGLADYVIGMVPGPREEYTITTLKVPIDRAETIREYLRFTGTPCWGALAPEHRGRVFDRS